MELLANTSGIHYDVVHMYPLRRCSYVSTTTLFIGIHYDVVHMYPLRRCSYVSTMTLFICIYYDVVHMYPLRRAISVVNKRYLVLLKLSAKILIYFELG